MRTIAIINQKGGCGKTTSAINLSAVLARSGKRVLLVDMDPQSHCAAGLGIPEQRIETDIGDAMLSIGTKPLDPARLLWRAVRNLDLAPSRMKLAGLEASKGGLAELPDKSRRLTAVLDKFRQDYDVAVIDCPPSIGLLTFNALASADMVIIPVETGFFSLQGATRQVNTVKALSKRLGVLIPMWMLPTLHESSNTVAQDLLEELNRRFKDKVVPVIIRRDTRLREAASFGQTIVDYAPGSMGSEDYGRLGVWVMENLAARTTAIAEAASSGAQFQDTIAGIETAEGSANLSYTTNTFGTQPATPANQQFANQFGNQFANQFGASTVSSSPFKPAKSEQGKSEASKQEQFEPAAFGQARTGEATDAKPLSRAEDVAKRAQEFLRRIAMGKAQANQAGNTPGSSNISSSPATPPPIPEFHTNPFAGSQPAVGTTSRVTPASPFERKPATPDVLTQGTKRQENFYQPQALIPADGQPKVSATVADVQHNATTTQTVLLHSPRNVLSLVDDASSQPVHTSAERLLGVTETNQGVLFVQPLAAGRVVAIAGTFNNWSPTTHIMRRNEALGVHELCLKLSKGRHEYRIVVDGNWISDPHNPASQPNPFGEVNSIFFVTDRSQQFAHA